MDTSKQPTPTPTPGPIHPTEEEVMMYFDLSDEDWDGLTSRMKDHYVDHFLLANAAHVDEGNVERSEHIVRCVNAHDSLTERVRELETSRDELVKALADLLDSINVAIDRSDSDLFGIGHNNAMDAIASAEAILSKVKE